MTNAEAIYILGQMQIIAQNVHDPVVILKVIEKVNNFLELTNEEQES